MSQNSAITDKFLTNASNMLLPAGYISEMILPSISVKETTGKIANYGNGHLRIENTVHIGEGPYARVDSITRGSDTYDIVEHGLQGTITDRDFRNVEKPYDARIDETLALTTHLWLGKEKGLADTLQNPTIITQGKTLAGNAQYNNRDHADSNPIEDMQEARDTILDAIGVSPNVAIMGRKTFNALRFHEQLLRSLGFSDNRAGSLSAQELAMALELDEIFVGDAVFNSAKQGQTAVIDQVWGKDLIYAKIGAPALRQKVLGWEIRKSGTSPRQVVRQKNFTPVGSEEIAVTDNYDQLILNAECAFLIQDAIA